MNAGLTELPLVLFTVLAQTAVGTFLLFVFALLKTENKFSRQYLHNMLLIPLVLLGIGFMASVAHLGSPLRAFNSLNRIGESMLSNEIASGAAFFITVSLYWLLAYTQKLPKILDKIWLLVAGILGILFMVMMANVYLIQTVPMWNTLLTPLSFYLTVIIGGVTLGYALLEGNRWKEYSLTALPYIFLLAFVVISVSVLYQSYHLGQFSQVNIADFVPMQALRLCLLGAAMLLLFKCKRPLSLWSSAILTIIAELIGRTLFYGLHFLVGIA